MKRVMIWILVGVFAVLTAFLAASGFYLPKKYDTTDDRYDEEASLMTEAQFFLIQGGLRASSSHNMQPWKIAIVDETTLELYADMDKTLPVIDPDHKQLLMSQGTFLQSLQETAEELGLSIAIEPASIDLASGQTKIATMTIETGVTSDDWTVAGASIHNALDSSPAFSIDAVETLFSGEGDVVRTWIEGDELAVFQERLLDATVLEGSDQAAMEELLSIFRFTRYQKNHFRYGLSLHTMAPWMQMFLEPILLLSSDPLAFGKSSIPPFQARLQTEHTYLILSMEQPDPWDYVELGRWTQAIANHFGDVAVRPAVQLLEPLEGMNDLLEAMTDDFHVPATPMIILGFQTPQATTHESLRHRVSDLIR